jgi:hypothetical protein
VSAPKKKWEGVSSVPIPNLSTCPSSPAAREPIFVAILFDLLRKKGALMQKTNVNHGKPMMDKLVRRRVTCVRRSKTLCKARVVYYVVLMSKERKKVVKKQRRSKKIG